ncbi:hypothetical protein OCAR_5920 [Afipia carboxidovorans OM5]|uniref:hypothetical protein n=1 Tax=Afipia carboxidovorans TaxID=40137 RepID=UPI0001737698|nr:hypothetical protein [Afipia carboxidovorans]ACI93041.1 hypothetical protein OCAR_5920 [Afipia carboxidovorans OM5]
MKIMKCLAPALFLSFFAMTPASALPASPAAGLDTVTASNLVQVQHRGRHHARPPVRHHRPPAYRPGGRYSTAPRGYRRYGARPHDWRARRCVMVGPVWFCP